MFWFATAVTLCMLACMQGAGAATREVTLRNSSKITVLTSDPGTASKDAGRLCMILPSGLGTEQVARAAMSNLGREFARRNWIVAVPVSPDGRSFFGRNGAMIPELIRVTRKDIGLGYGRTLLAGISNGGICALEIAGHHSGMFCGVIAVPGVLSGKQKLKQLNSMPVFLRIGTGDELKWNKAYPATVRRLKRAGAQLNAKLLPGTGHGISIDWKELDAWLAQISEKLPADSPRSRSGIGARNPSSRDLVEPEGVAP